MVVPLFSSVWNTLQGKLYRLYEQEVSRDTQNSGVLGILFLSYIKFSLERLDLCNVPSFYAMVHIQTLLKWLRCNMFECSRTNANDPELLISLLFTACMPEAPWSSQWMTRYPALFSPLSDTRSCRCAGTTYAFTATGLIPPVRSRTKTNMS